jgi:hypothetical protein
MDLTQLPVELWVSQGVFCILFIWLFMDTRKESKEREQRLSNQIDLQNIAQEKIVLSLQSLEYKMTNLKGEVK